MASKHQTAHEAFCLRYIEGRQMGNDERAGVNCGLGDAAHLIDAMRMDIVSGMRRSKRRTEIEALAKAFGDAIWAFRGRVMELPIAGREALARHDTAGQQIAKEAEWST